MGRRAGGCVRAGASVVAALMLVGGAAIAAPAPVGAAGRPAAAPAAAPAASAAKAAAEKEAGGCRKLPAGKRIVKLTLKPETELGDLIAWISSITCKQFIVPGTIPVGKKVTIFSPQLITANEAYRLFLSALDTVGLTVYPSGTFLRVIETTKAKSSPIPVYIDSPSADSDDGDEPGGATRTR
jgi:general secretion pathway protein D